MKNITCSITLAATLLVAPASEAAEKMVAGAVEKGIDAGFSELEKQIIERYFGKREVAAEEEDTGKKTGKGKGKKDRQKGLPPGLAKRDELPPGLAKRETLPPGLAKRSLPAELEEELPPAPPGYERKIIEDAAVVLIEKTTGKVTDIIKDVILGKKHE